MSVDCSRAPCALVAVAIACIGAAAPSRAGAAAAAPTGPTTAAAAAAAPATAASGADVARAHFEKGKVHHANGEYATAAAEYLAAYSAHTHPVYLYNAAVALRLAGMTAEALDQYRRLLEADPETTLRAEVDGRIAELERVLAAEASAGLPATTATLTAGTRPARGGGGLFAGLAVGGGALAVGVAILTAFLVASPSAVERRARDYDALGLGVIDHR